MKDESIVKHVGNLIEEEHHLFERGAVDEKERARAKAIEIVDQCWDLLRQRRAKQELEVTRTMPRCETRALSRVTEGRPELGGFGL